MRFTLINTLTLGLLTLAPGVLGDFHVAVSLFYSTYSSVGLVTSLGACPSNYFNCDCFQNSDRFAYGIGTDGDVSAPSFFSVEDLCGVSQVNFYQQGSASTYLAYINNGDGSVVATCYPGNHYNSATGNPDLNCDDPVNGVTQVYDQLVCYSYICN